MDSSDLLHPPTLVHALTAAAKQSALHQNTRTNPSSSPNVDAAAARAALEVCEKTAALLRAQLTDSQGDRDDTALPQPAKRRRTVERGDDDGAAASSSPRAAANTISVGTVRTDGCGTTVSWTKKVHTQQPDGSWRTAVVPCESRPALVDAAIAVTDSDVDILARMQDELRREVLDFSREEARNLGRVRIACKALHEAMMGWALDLSYLYPPSVDQLMALGRGTAFHKFKQVPVQQRCSCAAGQAFGHIGVGSEVSMNGWITVPDHDRLAVGVGRSWRVTCLDLRQGGVTLEQWRQLLRGLNLADTLDDLDLEFSGGVVDVSSTDPPIFSTLTKLTKLGLLEVSGSLSFLQNLTQLQGLDLSDTYVSGSLSFIQNLTQLQDLDLSCTQVSGSLSFLRNLTQLQRLNFEYTQVSGSLSFLQNLTQLQDLSLYGTQVSGSLSFLQNLTQLQYLYLYGTRVSGGLSFLQNLIQLQNLNLNVTQVSDSLSFLQNLTQLQQLILSDTQVSGSLSFLQNLTQLQHLYLNNTQVNGSLSFLQNLTQLQELSLSDIEVSGSQSSLQNLTQLKILDLSNTQVSGALPAV